MTPFSLLLAPAGLPRLGPRSHLDPTTHDGRVRFRLCALSKSLRMVGCIEQRQ